MRALPQARPSDLGLSSALCHCDPLFYTLSISTRHPSCANALPFDSLHSPALPASAPLIPHSSMSLHSLAQHRAGPFPCEHRHFASQRPSAPISTKSPVTSGQCRRRHHERWRLDVCVYAAQNLSTRCRAGIGANVYEPGRLRASSDTRGCQNASVHLAFTTDIGWVWLRTIHATEPLRPTSITHAIMETRPTHGTTTVHQPRRFRLAATFPHDAQDDDCEGQRAMCARRTDHNAHA
ncbi:hypothetical protein DFP72DRAFT_452177 [Ephemerocybe angulata]|uniref:Uncharacterized protein n=1 Tax=Ephemerocybe angulata TaxID=980116 RepID=A0A8H6M2S4_9AGAR|nr:hypothetical protein DFP72DRAFT_452177 [Tulosesus angulatus]